MKNHADSTKEYSTSSSSSGRLRKKIPFTKIPTALVKDCSVSNGAKNLFTLMVPKFRFSKTGTCRMQNVEIKEVLGISDSTILRYVNQLLGGGYIDVEYTKNHVIENKRTKWGTQRTIRLGQLYREN